MTAERALLERAAKAAGSHDLFFQWEQEGKTLRYVGQREWNPLADDGDALRLAVKLGIEISIRSATTAAYLWEPVPSSGRPYAMVHFSDSTDPYAATRLAIVRAAASMAGGEGG